MSITLAARGGYCFIWLMPAALLFVASFVDVGLAKSTDPRCTGYTCGFTADTYSRTSIDDTTCWNGCAEKCLVGTDWDDRRTELGTGLVDRTFVPSIIFDDWLSAEITESTFRILLEEMMGYKVEGVTGVSSGYDVLCCDRNLLIMERWPQDDIPDDDNYFSLTEVSVGYEGGSGIYVSSQTVAEYPLATAYNAYKYLPNYTNIFPTAFSTPCTNASVDTSLGCTDGNYYCDLNTWTNTSCVTGRYVPPVCQSDPSQCQEMYHVQPDYESGFFEGLIKNTGLKFTVVYVGLENLRNIVVERNSKNQHSFFYAWEPDSLVALLDATPVTFKTPDAECKKKEDIDPTLNKADCDYQKSTLTKLALKSRLLLDSDFKYFFESFQISSTDIKAMLRQHPQGGGSLPVYNISCDWLKNNYGTWKDWIRNTPTTATVAAASSGSNMLAIIVAVVVSVVVLALSVALIYGFMVFRAKQAVKFAPKKAPFALMFTDVESSTMLWERHGPNMEIAMELHHSTIRDLITEYQCYEVKTIGDSFMIACPTLIDGAMLALAIQSRLFEAMWPEPLRDWKDMPEGTATDVWNGLRVRIGLHYCREAEPKFDVIHKRYDYYGHDVNMTARVEQISQGGQILVTEETFHELREDPDFQSMIGEDAHIIRFAVGAELKGVSDRVNVYSLLPAALAARQFVPLVGAIEGPEVVASSAEPSSKRSNDSVAHSLMSVRITPAQDTARRLASLIFNCVPKEDRDAILKKCSAAKGVTLPENCPFHRKLRAFLNSIDDGGGGGGGPLEMSALGNVSGAHNALVTSLRLSGNFSSSNYAKQADDGMISPRSLSEQYSTSFH